MPDRLKDVVGAGKPGVFVGVVVFCRAMLAKASRIDWLLCAGGAAAVDAAGSAFEPNEASKFGGGLPGGVVEASRDCE